MVIDYELGPSLEYQMSYNTNFLCWHTLVGIVVWDILPPSASNV